MATCFLKIIDPLCSYKIYIGDFPALPDELPEVLIALGEDKPKSVSMRDLGGNLYTGVFKLSPDFSGSITVTAEVTYNGNKVANLVKLDHP